MTKVHSKQISAFIDISYSNSGYWFRIIDYRGREFPGMGMKLSAKQICDMSQMRLTENLDGNGI
jgi:hypothetical protein